MLSIYKVCFFGHREIADFRIAEEKTEKLINELIKKKEYVEIAVGRDGEYDQIVSSAVIRAKKNFSYGNCCLICVLPYPRAIFSENKTEFEKYYDEIEICEESLCAHPKAAIQKRNQSMIDRSDLCVFYVEHKSGGAYATMKYAIKQNKKIINLYEDKKSLSQ